MAIRIRKHGTVIASFATPQEIVISHLNDSMQIGDGTNLLGTFPLANSVRSLPVYLEGAVSGAKRVDFLVLEGIVQAIRRSKGSRRPSRPDPGSRRRT